MPDQPFPDALFRTLVQFAPDSFILTDRHGTIVYANAQSELLFGYSRDELVGMPVDALVPEATRPHHVDDRDQYFADPQPRPMGIGLDLAARRRDGSEVPVEISLSPVYTDADRYVVATVRDVSERRRMEDAVRTSEERYRLLADNAEDVVYRISLSAWPPCFEYVSPSVTLLTGHAPVEFLERPGLLLDITHPDDRQLVERWLRNPSGFSEQLLARAVRPDGSVVWHEQRYTAILDESGQAIAIDGIARDVTEQRELDDERRLLLAEAEIERERERIAADLHDGVMQTMYSVGLQLSSIVRRVTDLPPETREGMQEAIAALDAAIGDIRRYVMDLRPVDFSGDLSESLTSLARLFESTSGITTAVEIGKGVPVVDEATGVELFLLAREALSNVRRHARASSVVLKLGVEGRVMSMEVSDDGVGFDLVEMRRDSQFGLRNMETRARMMGGELTLSSTPGAGTRVHVEFPVGG